MVETCANPVGIVCGHHRPQEPSRPDFGPVRARAGRVDPCSINRNAVRGSQPNRRRTTLSNGDAPHAQDDERRELTDRQLHPVYDNQNQRTIGPRGPATLGNYHSFDKLGHFDRERVPERVVHARGATAFGYFETYGAYGDEPISRYTRAKLFQEKAKRTDVAVRF